MQTSLAIKHQEFAERRQRLAAYLREQGLAGAVLYDNYYMLYYSGFAFVPTERPMAFLLTAEGEPALFVPRLELEHARSKTHLSAFKDYVEYPYDPHPATALAELLARWALRAPLAPITTAIPGSSAIAARA